MEPVLHYFDPQLEPEELLKRSQLSGCSGCTRLHRPPAELSLDKAEGEIRDRKINNYIKVKCSFRAHWTLGVGVAPGANTSEQDTKAEASALQEPGNDTLSKHYIPLNLYRSCKSPCLNFHLSGSPACCCVAQWLLFPAWSSVAEIPDLPQHSLSFENNNHLMTSMSLRSAGS